MILHAYDLSAVPPAEKADVSERRAKREFDVVLGRNRRMLERRLRDLGLLVGVNDAERMKKLKARYRSAYECADEMEAT